MCAANLCKRCGRCCRQKLFTGKELVYMPFYCQFFNEETRLCRVYKRRFEANPQCLTIDEAIEAGCLPADCPYVAGASGYRPPREECAASELREYLELTEGAPIPKKRARKTGI